MLGANPASSGENQQQTRLRGLRYAIGGRQRILPSVRLSTGSRDANLFGFE